MIIDYLRNAELRSMGKLLLVLYSVRMADRVRLAKILGRSVYTIDKYIERWNKKGGEEKFIISRSAPFKKGGKMYQLGPAGWRWVMEYLDENRKYLERSESQKEHYNGMTDILIRLIEKMGREEVYERVKYYNTFETTELFTLPWRLINWETWQGKNRYEQKKELPHPDLLLTIDEWSFWIEYDTGNEDIFQIWEKYRRYFRHYPKLPESMKHPVVWITKKTKRKRDLEQWLKSVEKEPEFKNLSREKYPPMIILTEGEDTEFFLSGHSAEALARKVI